VLRVLNCKARADAVNDNESELFTSRKENWNF